MNKMILILIVLVVLIVSFMFFNWWFVWRRVQRLLGRIVLVAIAILVSFAAGYICAKVKIKNKESK